MTTTLVRRSRQSRSVPPGALWSALLGDRQIPRRRDWERAIPIPPGRAARSTRPRVSRDRREVIRDHTFHRQGESEIFPCDGSLYLSLLNEPLVPLTLWKDLSDSPVQLQKIGPDRYEGTDGAGASAVWDFVLRTPRLHVLLAYFSYVSPRSNARVDARIVLIVHSSLLARQQQRAVDPARRRGVREGRQQGLEDPGADRPPVDRAHPRGAGPRGGLLHLADEPAGRHLPNWACQVVGGQQAIDATTRQRFQALVAQTRKPGASKGGPWSPRIRRGRSDPRRR